MFKNLSVIIVLFLLVAACSSTKKPKKPDNLISKDKMTQVVYDLYVINAAKGVNRRLLENNGIVPESYILSKHNIDFIQFADSNAYYAFSPDVYKAIVDEVKERLEKEKEVYEEIEKIEGQAAKKRRDSISAIKNRKKDSIKKATKKDTLGMSKLDSIKRKARLKAFN